MKIILFWLARTSLTVVAWAVLYLAGWHHWTSVLGAVALAWLITYLMFGSLYDSAAKQVDALIARRFTRSQVEDADAEDAEAEVSA